MKVNGSCPEWCSEHFDELGVCEAAPIATPNGGEIRMCVDPDTGVYLSAYGPLDQMTVEQAEAAAYALLAMTARAKAAAARPTLRAVAL